MKTILSLVAALVLFSVQVSAQFTVTQSSYPTSPNSFDSVSIVYGTTGLPTNIGPGGALVWDFSKVAYGYIDTPQALYLPYTGFSFQEFAVHNIKLPQLFYNARSLYTLNTNGISKFGERVDGKGYSLFGAQGANIGDSIVFPFQIDTFSVPYTKIPFPATFNTIWSSSYKTSTKYLMTYSIYYNHAPGIYRSYVTEKDTVIGVGKAVVKGLDNQLSAAFDVLEVKVKYHQIDSFFLNGTLADSALLSLFGLAQGQATDIYKYKFYRADEMTPLVDISFPDNTYNKQTITRTLVHTQRIPTPNVAVPVVATGNDITVYPNPVTGGVLTVNIPGTVTGDLSYTLTNIAGKVIATNNMTSASGKANVLIPNDVVPGTYYLQLSTNGKLLSTKTIEVN